MQMPSNSGGAGKGGGGGGMGGGPWALLTQGIQDTLGAVGGGIAGSLQTDAERKRLAEAMPAIIFQQRYGNLIGEKPMPLVQEGDRTANIMQGILSGYQSSQDNPQAANMMNAWQKMYMDQNNKKEA